MKKRVLVAALVLGAMSFVGGGSSTHAVAQEGIAPATLVGIWSVRREVTIASPACRGAGARVGDHLAQLWTIDVVDGGTSLRVETLGRAADGYSRYRAQMAGAQIQLTASNGARGASTILLTKPSEHQLSGTESVVDDGCRMTRLVTAVRIH